MKYHLSGVKSGKTECGLPWSVDADPFDEDLLGWSDGILGVGVRLSNEAPHCCVDCAQGRAERLWERQLENFYGG